MSYVVVSVLMVACIVMVAMSVRTKPEQMVKLQPAVVQERDAELRAEAIANFKPRKLSGRGKNYRTKRRAGKCRAKGR
jgi:hypothetical protein